MRAGKSAAAGATVHTAMSDVDTERLPAARVGVGGPVGSGKTALVEKLHPALHAKDVDLAVITNDLVTKEYAQRLRRSGLKSAGPCGSRGDRRLPAYGDPRGPHLEHPGGGQLESNFRAYHSSCSNPAAIILPPLFRGIWSTIGSL